MPQRQLNIRSDEAYARATGLASRLAKTTTENVNGALKAYEDNVEPRDERGLTPERRKRFDSIMAAAAELHKHIPPGTVFDDSWMYDENGLPK